MGRSADKSLRVNDYSQGRIDILERFTGKCGGVDELGWTRTPDIQADVIGKTGVRGCDSMGLLLRSGRWDGGAGSA